MDRYLICQHRKTVVFKCTCSDYESAVSFFKTMHNGHRVMLPKTYLYIREGNEWRMLMARETELNAKGQLITTRE